MKYLATIPLAFSFIGTALCMRGGTVRDIYESDTFAPMKLTLTSASREATVDLPPVKAIISDGEDKSPMVVRFMLPFLAAPERERAIILPMLVEGNGNVQMNAFDQPSDAVAVKCAFFDDGGLIIYSGDLLVDGVFDAGTTVTSPNNSYGVLCDAYYSEPSPSDLRNNFTDGTLRVNRRRFTGN